MPDDWLTVDASAWTLAGVEQQGLHAHELYRHASEARTWLFKPARPERHRAIGEDIVEKVASELARLVGVPAARVELADRGAVHGVLGRVPQPRRGVRGAARRGRWRDGGDVYRSRLELRRHVVRLGICGEPLAAR